MLIGKPFLLVAIIWYKIDVRGGYQMFCSDCGTHVQDGDHFCNNCGAPLQAPGGINQQPSIPIPPATPSPSKPAASKISRVSSSNKPQDPYKDQIQQLK